MQKITTFDRYLAPAGRLLMGTFFILSGFAKVVFIPATAAHIASVGLPFSTILTLVAVSIEIVCGFMLLTGYKGKIAALVLAIFVLVVSLPFHGPSTWANDPIQQSLFMKNIAIFGALLFMAAHIGRVAVVPETKRTMPQPTL